MSALEPPLVALDAFSSGVGRSALRKASLHLLPLLGVAYGIAYMDRANVSYAALQMNQDLHFSASMYGLGAGLFFISYSIFEVPSNLLLVRYGARRWLARILVTWGLLAMGMLLVRTPMQFYVMRCLLGAAEAGFFPGVIFYLTQWFPSEQRARSISRFYVSYPLSGALMGALAGALLNLQGRLGLSGWQWIFLVEGLPAVLIGVLFFFVLPDSPSDARWLTPDERDWILQRIRQQNALEAVAHDGSWRTLALEPRFWAIACVFFCFLVVAYGYNLSAPLILQQLTHMNATHVGFLNSGANLVGAVVMMLVASHSDRVRERYLHVIVPFLVATLAFAAAGLSANAWVAVPALSILVVTFSATLGVGWAIPSEFLTGRSAATGIAALNSIGILGAFVGPWCMGVARDLTGSYQRGLLLCTIPCLVLTACLLWMRRYASRQA